MNTRPNSLSNPLSNPPSDDQQRQRAVAFKALHDRAGLFVIPNPWDAGSAKLLAGLGFEALATTSAGLAFSLGKSDGEGAVSRDQFLLHAQSITAATALPVSGDLEKGFGDDPEICAETILLAAKTGLVGGSIEDASGDPDDPIFSFDLSVQRIKAAVQAAHGLPFPFTLTARAENLLHGRNDLKDTIRRLVAYADAGADTLFAPGLKTKEEIDQVVRAVAPRPVNVLAGITGFAVSLDELKGLGVKRVSVGSSLSRVAYGAFLRAAKEIRNNGTFDFAADTIPFTEINTLFSSIS
jgi:2-methylisocitrate lyase-like PEP mutase family enzyme